ncbi:hypothetical protein HORIV_36710 [Vreelandella olivaria]|uniref:Uncharacterized protein n=1 Tax=Vreelandella olivaria TaxID=390919 RepID=A0ABN5WWK6_9GAMM|nr:hypothetical protein HORIV_36710 [Halomonas olivaria]
MSCKIDYQPAPNLLENRIVLVTGAGDGIGRAAALSYAQHGATVILLGRTIAKLERVYDEIEAAGGPQPAIFPLNFEGATLKDFHDMAETLDKEFGRLDGLLHNAGLLGRITPFEQYNPELWQQVMQVNINGPIWMTQALLPLLQASDDASVILPPPALAAKVVPTGALTLCLSSPQRGLLRCWPTSWITSPISGLIRSTQGQRAPKCGVPRFPEKIL